MAFKCCNKRANAASDSSKGAPRCILDILIEEEIWLSSSSSGLNWEPSSFPFLKKPPRISELTECEIMHVLFCLRSSVPVWVFKLLVPIVAPIPRRNFNHVDMRSAPIPFRIDLSILSFGDPFFDEFVHPVWSLRLDLLFDHGERGLLDSLELQGFHHRFLGFSRIKPKKTHDNYTCHRIEDIPDLFSVHVPHLLDDGGCPLLRQRKAQHCKTSDLAVSVR